MYKVCSTKSVLPGSTGRAPSCPSPSRSRPPGQTSGTVYSTGHCPEDSTWADFSSASVFRRCFSSSFFFRLSLERLRSAVQHSAVQFSAVKCSEVQCSAVQCSTGQCSALQSSPWQCRAVQHSAIEDCHTTQTRQSNFYCPFLC